ncbi:MAG: 1-(5-phosphoribosyl)-5-[(5-phosphoribosylamino)methylideneamino]imidazole-4-carboxamide isomerase [Phycisphaerae bacterium]|nr:1-(5-phosphoribosyl)-5-[(5-phosphoribosylamino)methylideneamino]imidazole-4-carboxamide isomerase [Phycisphaerae bacterium]
MDILPAIDLREGNVVRLLQGDYDRQTTYADDPAAMAQQFIDAGAKWIHVVDLDAARSGELTNTDALRAICAKASAAGVKVQNGGGIRDTDRVERLLELGVSRLVVGSAAMKHRDWFEGLLNDPAVPNEKLALGLDARDGKLAAEGWTEQLEQTAEEFAARVNGTGLGAIVYTDIARDGMLRGVNIEATKNLIRATDVPVIASGGVASLEDIRQCSRIGCEGVILGKALYEGKVNLAEALAMAGKST